MKITIENYVIRPYQNGLCWTIDKMTSVKKRDGSVKQQLISTKKFPTSLKSAVNLVIEMLLKDSNIEINTTVSDGLTSVSKSIDEMYQNILNKISITTLSKKK